MVILATIFLDYVREIEGGEGIWDVRTLNSRHVDEQPKSIEYEDQNERTALIEELRREKTVTYGSRERFLALIPVLSLTHWQVGKYSEGYV